MANGNLCAKSIRFTKPGLREEGNLLGVILLGEFQSPDVIGLVGDGEVAGLSGHLHLTLAIEEYVAMLDNVTGSLPMLFN